MIHPDLHLSADAIQRIDAASVQTRAIAEVLGQFVEQLEEAGFSQDGAERLADTLMVAMVTDG